MTGSKPYDAHGPGVPVALGEQSYAHLGYMASIGPTDLAHHLTHAHRVTPDALPGGWRAAGWCRQVELHAAHHGVDQRPSDDPIAGRSSGGEQS